MKVKIIECPRDAMQGLKAFVPTDTKIRYISKLAEVGFDTIDFGSFVSPKAIPQMADTPEITHTISGVRSTSSFLAIIANRRGAVEALKYNRVNFLGFPFSVSETFQQRNTNASVNEALVRVKDIAMMCNAAGRELVIYISMGFGNPYGDMWSEQIVLDWCSRMADLGVKTISLSDTVGVGTAEKIYSLYKTCTEAIPNLEWGVHLHATSHDWREKIEAAWEAGCRRFDGALKGYGGCPMAADELTGNIATENLIQFFEEKGIELNLNKKALNEAIAIADEIFAEVPAY